MAVAIPNQIKWQEPTIELNKVAILNRLLTEANTTIGALIRAISTTQKNGDDLVKVALELLHRDWQEKVNELTGILDMPICLPDFSAIKANDATTMAYLHDFIGKPTDD
jgi:hypothetical protein